MNYSIVEIKLKNFLQFRNAAVKFNTAPGRNITVIQGPGGSGKTGLLKAIDWCLYNTPASEGIFVSTHPVCNFRTFNALKPCDSAEICVELRLDTPEGPLQVSRSVKVYKDQAGGEFMDSKTMRFTACRLTKAGSQALPAPGNVAETIFPPAMRAISFIDADYFRIMPHIWGKNEVKKALLGFPQAVSESTLNRLERDGLNAAKSLSAGEQVRLGYSVLSDLREKSGLASPLIIDSPFAMLPCDCFGTIAEWFKERFKASQVILLVSGGIYPKELVSTLAPAVSDRYLIQPSLPGVSEVKKTT